MLRNTAIGLAAIVVARRVDPGHRRHPRLHDSSQRRHLSDHRSADAVQGLGAGTVKEHQACA